MILFSRRHGRWNRANRSRSQLARPGDSGRLTFTVGKYFVDIFDDYIYARPGNTFLNWTVLDRGAFDAAESWDFIYGATAEWKRIGGPPGPVSSCRKFRMAA
jgi:hypothetical protein